MKSLFCVVFFVEIKAIFCKTKDVDLLIFYKTVIVRNIFKNLLLMPMVLVFANWSYVRLS